jgi:hypothetical protein
VDERCRRGLLPDSCFHRSAARGGSLKRTKYFFGARRAQAAAQSGCMAGSSLDKRLFYSASRRPPCADTCGRGSSWARRTPGWRAGCASMCRR